MSIIEFFRVKIEITNSKEQNYVIFDGPGYRFTDLTKKSHNSFIFASTCQCLVHFLLTYQFQPQYNSIFSYSYAIGGSTVYKTFHVYSGTLIQMPFINCLNSFCVHIVKTNKHSQLNLTVLDIHMSVQSHEKSNCLFQGLFFGEIGKLHSMTMDEICSDINSSLHSSMLNFHTRGSSVYMVLYWYKGYTNINATVNVSVTKCIAVYLNICEYHQKCRNTSVVNAWYSKFMFTVGYHTDLAYSGCGNDKYREHFGLPTGQCIVLILMNKMTSSSSKIDIYKFFMTDMCVINLYQGYQQTKINYINGVLEKGSYVEIVGRKDCFSSKQPMCNNILIKRSALEYYHYKLTNRFEQHFTNGILQISIKFNSFEIGNQVNIMLTGMKGRGEEEFYALTSHPITDTISTTLLDAITPYYGSVFGVDWMLSIDRNVQLGPQYKTTKCTFIIKRNLGLITRLAKHGLVISGMSKPIFLGMFVGHQITNISIYSIYFNRLFSKSHQPPGSSPPPQFTYRRYSNQAPRMTLAH